MMAPPNRGARKVARILIVDDDELNRELLDAYLDGAGHELDHAVSGEAALAQAATSPPDLVLLDVMMPGIDGFTTATRLKAMFPDVFLPIVLVTALGDRASRVRGLAAGADEFLTKPLDRDELLVRIGNLLALRAHEHELARRSVDLLELSRFKDDMLATLVHDLRSLATVILGAVDFVSRSPELDADSREVLDDCRQASGRMMRMVANILDLSRAEEGRLSPRPAEASLHELVRIAVAPRRQLFERRGIFLDLAEGDLWAEVDRDLLVRALENLFDNAARYAPVGGRVHAGVTSSGHEAVIRIGNNGAPIPEAARDRIFEKYVQVAGASGALRTHNVGLGLYFCRLAIEAHGGRVWIEGTDALPVVFALALPMTRAGRRGRTTSMPAQSPPEGEP